MCGKLFEKEISAHPIHTSFDQAALKAKAWTTKMDKKDQIISGFHTGFWHRGRISAILTHAAKFLDSCSDIVMNYVLMVTPYLLIVNVSISVNVCYINSALFQLLQDFPACL